jgi:glycosyltransferase involved in cell wall biosynthesis
MKIGIDARLWHETGVGRYIRNLVTYLAEIDQYNNEYILFLREKEYKNLITPGNNFRKRLADVQWHSVAEQTDFLKILNQEQLDLMHFPYFSFPMFYARPFVVTIHDLILFHYPTGKASRLPAPMYAAKLFAYKQLLHYAARHAKKIIAVSNATKNEIIDHLHVKPEEIIVTYEGVDLQTQSASFTMQHELIKDNAYFLYVGNAYPHKNLDKLLKAFTEFHQEVPGVALVLVGKQDYFYEELQRRLLTFGIEKSVVVLSQVSDDELIFLYKHAIALVMPSLMEGFGLPTIEAMKNNCLVLASAIPSLQEICQEAAIYFDPTDRQAIVKILKKVYFDQGAFTQNKLVGLQRVELFSWRKMAEETLQVYESITPSFSLRDIEKNSSKNI